MGWSFEMVDRGRSNFIAELTGKSHFSEAYTPLKFRVICSSEWQYFGCDTQMLERGLIHLTKEAAEAHANALLSFTRSDV